MISRGPRAAMAPPTARSTSAALLVSPWKALARPPALAIRVAVSSAEAPSRSSAATEAPPAPRASAIARPIPEPAPVTTANRSLSAIAKSSPPSYLSPRLAADPPSPRLRASPFSSNCGLRYQLGSRLAPPALNSNGGQRLSSNYCLSPRLAALVASGSSAASQLELLSQPSPRRSRRLRLLGSVSARTTVSALASPLSSPPAPRQRLSSNYYCAHPQVPPSPSLRERVG